MTTQDLIQHRQITGTAKARAIFACESDPEWLRLADKLRIERRERDYWELVVRELRSSWRTQNDNANPTDRDFINYEPKHIALFKEAARKIGGVIRKADKHRKDHADECERLAIKMARREQEVFAGLPREATNVEAYDALQASREAKQQRIDRDGCCGGEPMAGGQCFGMGMCPRVQEAARAAAFCASYLAWLDQYTNESALAGLPLGSVPVSGETA